MNMSGEKKAIIISCFDWYEQRLVYIEKYLLKNGYTVTILMSDFNHQNKEMEKKYTNLDGMEYIHVTAYKKNLSLARVVSHLEFSKAAKKMVKKISPQLIYCLIPPNSLVRDISLSKKKLKFKLVYDVIDLWPESFPGADIKILPFRFWKNYRDKTINMADLVVLECDYYKDVLRNIVEESKMYVFSLIKKPLKSQEISLFSKKEIFLGYIGSINNLIDIDRICSIVKKMIEIKPVNVKIVGDGARKQEFISKLESVGAKVTYHGKIFNIEDIYNILGGCHFGINIYKENIKIGLTMKSVDYFQMGLPIINSISGDTRDMVNHYKIGINIEDFSKSNFNEYLNNILVYKKKVIHLFNSKFNANHYEQMIDFLEKVI